MTTLKNSAVNVSHESAIRSFKEGVRRRELKKELGRQKPKTISEMMEIANRWADGEESLRSDRARSPKNNDGHNERRDKRRRTHERDSKFVATEFSKGLEGGYHGNRDWKPRPEEKPIR